MQGAFHTGHPSWFCVKCTSNFVGFSFFFFLFLSLQTPWLEYMDYMKVRGEQQAAAQQWEVVLFRTEGYRVKRPVLPNPEDTIGPNERILKRSV